MLDWLHRFDVALFHFLNVRIQNPLFDVIMPYLTKTRHWRIPIGLLWLALMFRGGRKGRQLALVLVPAIAAIDISVDHLVKPAIGRVRPCHIYQHFHLLIGCQRSFSFPSNHAANMFAAATLFAACYGRKIGLVCFVLAGVVGFSRVYVGVHYPFDVFGGAVLGVAWGLLVSVLWRTMEGRRGGLDGASPRGCPAPERGTISAAASLEGFPLRFILALEAQDAGGNQGATAEQRTCNPSGDPPRAGGMAHPGGPGRS